MLRYVSECRGWIVAVTCCISLFGLNGCRQSAPPPTVARVDTAVLLCKHPNYSMLTDIDHRLAGLRIQQDRLAARPHLQVPVSDIEIPVPAVSALVAPAPFPTLTSTDTQPVLRLRFEELQRSLEREEERLYAREERSLRAKAEASRTTVRMELRANAEMQKTLLAKAQRGKLTRLRISAVTTQQYATLNPEANNRAASAKTAYEQALASYDDALQNIDVEIADKAIIADEQQRKSRLRAELSALRTRLRADTQAQLASEKQQAATDDEWQPATPLVSSVVFPSLPSETQVLHTGNLTQDIASTNTIALRDQVLASHAIESTARGLQRQRTVLYREMMIDTRAAAQSVASAHGYQLSGGRMTPDITPNVQTWLKEYWGTP